MEVRGDESPLLLTELGAEGTSAIIGEPIEAFWNRSSSRVPSPGEPTNGNARCAGRDLHGLICHEP